MSSDAKQPEVPLYWHCDIDAAMLDVRKHLSRLDMLCYEHKYAHDEYDCGDWILEELRSVHENVEKLQVILDYVFSDDSQRWWMPCDDQQ